MTAKTDAERKEAQRIRNKAVDVVSLTINVSIATHDGMKARAFKTGKTINDLAATALQREFTRKR